MSHWFLQSLADNLAGTVADDLPVPVPGHDVPWRAWVERIGGLGPMAPRHERLWDWFDALQAGQRPRAAIECWPRGGAKSSTVEMCTCRLVCTARRRFVLYVSGTQDQANLHVQAIAEHLEAMGVGRAVNTYGHSRGWRQNILRAQSNVNVLAVGLDVGVRGVKLGRLRPDLIVLDDVDSIEDTPAAVDKKIRQITRSILPAGSPDCAICFIQNKIHAGSVMARLADGRAGFLSRRDDVEIIPALYDLVLDGARIVSGRPSWETQGLEVCQQQIEDWGLDAFLIEAQHDTRVGGQIFLPEFEPVRGGKPWHVIAPSDEPAYELRLGGVDFGTRAPFAHCTVGVDRRGGLVVSHLLYQPGLDSVRQAQTIRDHLTALLGAEGHRRVTNVCDSAMFPAKDVSERIGKAEIEDYWEAGLVCVPAVKDRVAGWNRLRQFLTTTLTDAKGNSYPALRVVGARCPDLLREVDQAVSALAQPDDLDASCSDHALDALRYLVMSRPSPPRKPSEPVVDHWQLRRRRQEPSKL